MYIKTIGNTLISYMCTPISGYTCISDEEFELRFGFLPSEHEVVQLQAPEDINAQAIAELSMSYAQEMEQAQAAIMELSMLIGGITS